MAADAARWSTTPPSVQWAGCVLLLAAISFMSWTMRTNSFAAPVMKIQKERGQTAITTDRRGDGVSTAFRMMEEDRGPRGDPPFWERPPEPPRSKMWRDIGLPFLVSLLSAAVGIAWITRGLGH
jgi:hypothetical protein